MDGGVALQQGLGESGGASGHKHAAPTGLDGFGGAFGYKHVAPTGLDPSRAPKLFLNKTQKDYYEN